MPIIIYVEPNGRRSEVNAAVGQNLMQLAFANGICGLVGECSGSAMCATCHIYFDVTKLALMPAMSGTEDAMLGSVTAERRPESRLACQIQVTEDMDGLILRLPESQM